MPCMCGDICCWSCGPAQGNWRCPICNEWASEGCDHISEETGDLRPEFEHQAEETLRREREAEDQLAADIQWERDHADEIREALERDEEAE